MQAPPVSPPHLAESSKKLAHQVLATAGNRLELLLVELQEERQWIAQSLWLSAGAAAFGLLAGITLTAAITVACWQWSPLGTLCILTALYALTAAGLYLQLSRMLNRWKSFAATREELRKDRECLEKYLN